MKIVGCILFSEPGQRSRQHAILAARENGICIQETHLAIEEKRASISINNQIPDLMLLLE